MYVKPEDLDVDFVLSNSILTCVYFRTRLMKKLNRRNLTKEEDSSQ